MTLTNLRLEGPVRCLITCRKHIFDKYADDRYGSAIIKAAVKQACGDYAKASLLGTIEGGNVFIVFDYEKFDHGRDCEILRLKAKERKGELSIIVKQRLPTIFKNRVHSEVDTWLNGFPHYGKVRLWSIHRDFFIS